MCPNKTQLRKQKIKVGMRKIISISFFLFRKYGLLKFEECLSMSSFEKAQSVIDFTLFLMIFLHLDSGQTHQEQNVCLQPQKQKQNTLEGTPAATTAWQRGACVFVVGAIPPTLPP
jgi:hypothetical protein